MSGMWCRICVRHGTLNRIKRRGMCEVHLWAFTACKLSPSYLESWAAWRGDGAAPGPGLRFEEIPPGPPPRLEA